MPKFCTRTLALARDLEHSTWLREVLCPACAVENVTTQHSDTFIICVGCKEPFEVPEMAA